MITAGFFPITLVSRVEEYDQVQTLTFSTPEPLRFVAGQYVHLLAPGSPPGPENVRHFSIASVPGEPVLRFTMDLAPTSDYKKKLANLPLGEKAHLFKVKGDFVLGEPIPRKIVFLAGGLGITPVRSLLGRIVGEGLDVEWRLAHVARGAHLYEEEIQKWRGVQARIRRQETLALVDQWMTELPEACWYLSGSHRFVDSLGEALVARGLATDHLRVEDFR
jgi:ferredoxin-NADP reductase